MKHIPTLYQWAGGLEVIKELITKFYDKVVTDDVLKDLFTHMSEEHQINVARFISEVLGGPKLYTENGGSHFGMIKKHFQKNISEEQRRRWMNLLLEIANELKLPDDPEFRSAFVAYLEWGTRLAVINSNSDTIDMAPDEPMPKWGWGETGGPYNPNGN
ncbi:group II truncated hemoglobin [Sinomicrobium weinanense]|uniref:Globin n=1 Tax=Sinomicrobium weinanense TaxID=2842200 RepID=A0A926JWZ3_9FLAO|nr:group II truncated hemoglobin [Sinomicrobium weinanense]MBC9798681.1 globin [Sinomicrobium weinanense]MBU3126034.1 group II truncated hemoglobin [Sinomicrobium weinanense]